MPVPHVLVVRDPSRSYSGRLCEAFAECFRRRRWRVTQTTEPTRYRGAAIDLVAAWGWGDTVQTAARQLVPSNRYVHADNALIAGPRARGGKRYKIALDGRFTALDGGIYPPDRLKAAGIYGDWPAPSREPPAAGVRSRVMVCGMSPKAAEFFGTEGGAWERSAMIRLLAAGAVVVYRPKPDRPPLSNLPRGIVMDPCRGRPLLPDALERVDAVATYQSNASLEALAMGLPVYCEFGPAKALAVKRLEDLIGAAAASLEARTRLLVEVAFHQWTVPEIALGHWLEPPAPLAGRLSRILGVVLDAPMEPDTTPSPDERIARRIQKLEAASRLRTAARA